ncbi:MAG: hypothetical protein JWQ96_1694 [Segetibacter sp.]|nr:hypothetical protein [Segetibacter sp.]
MSNIKSGLIHLQNNSASLTIDSFGGAITSFELKDSHINPLSFAFAKEQMPANNKAGAVYQGHFACIGRWGEPSAGEAKSGIPNHGEPANIEWTVKEQLSDTVQIQSVALKEGLEVDRTVLMDAASPAFIVHESITNINPLGRIYNIVQHPTIARPFLDDATIIDFNGQQGFDQANFKNIHSNIIQWPFARSNKNDTIDLRNPEGAYNAVFSFVVNPADQFGWITAYSPTHHFLLGYLWKRSDYPWIHLWQHYEGDKILYRGLEFGTAGLHQPFHTILNTASTLFGEDTYAYIDSGEVVSKSYLSFIHATPHEFTGVESATLNAEGLRLKVRDNNTDIIIKLSQKLIDGLQ